MIIGVMFGSLILLLLTGTPLIYALGFSSVLAFIIGDYSLTLLITRIFEGINSFSLLAIPFFIITGELLNRGGGTDKLIKLSQSLVGHFHGALAMINIVASMFFAGISGSASADTAGIGSIMIPAMEKEGYPNGYSCVVTAASACIGPIIPPSVVAIIYGTVAGLPIADLFIGGLLPGLLVTLLLSIVAYIQGIRLKHPVHERAKLNEIIRSFIEAIPALMIPVIIVLGIVGGVFTPTEAGVFTTLVALIVSMFIYKGLTFKAIRDSLTSTAKISGKLMYIVGIAYVFSWIISRERFAELIIHNILELTENTIIITFLLVMFLLLVGTLIESISAIIILGPPLVDVAIMLGFDPIHFAVLASMALTMGMTTPPVGIGLFITSEIAGIEVTETYRYLLPFLLALVLSLLFVAYIPGLVTWLT